MFADPHNQKAADEKWLKEQHKSLYSYESLGFFDSAKVMEKLHKVIEYAYMYRNEKE